MKLSHQGSVIRRMKGLNRTFKAERPGMSRRTLLAMSLALGLGAMLMGATILVAFRGAFAGALREATSSRIGAEFAVVVLAWPLVVALLVLAAAVHYWLGPDREANPSDG